MKVKSEREVSQSYLTLRDPMDCSLPGSSIHGIFPGSPRETLIITIIVVVITLELYIFRHTELFLVQ